jgi:hypothetical protein
MTIEIDLVDVDDISLKCACGESSFLSSIIRDETKNTEKYLCKANATDFYGIICALELMANDMRKTYEKWKEKDFEK